MKAIIFLGLIAFATAQYGFLQAKTDAISNENPLTINGTVQDLQDFYTGIGSHFNVDCTPIVNCYNLATAEAYFQLQGVSRQIQNAVLTGDRATADKLGKIAAGLEVIIANASSCAKATDAFAQLQKAAGWSNNQTDNEIRLKLYGQGEMNFYYDAYEPVYNQLTQGLYKQAGATSAPIYSQIAANASASNVFHNGVQGFHLGNFFYYNLSAPNSFFGCFDENSSTKLAALIGGWSKAVAESSATTANEATKTFFEDKGNALLEDLKPNVECMDKTQDQANFNKAVGYDVHSDQFRQLSGKYMEEHQAAYFAIFSEIWKLAQSNDPLSVGYTYAVFI